MDQMSERPEPDLDKVREALRQHDERTQEPEEPEEPVPEPDSEDSDD